MTEDLKEQIRKAQAEMATWSEDKRKSVRLEGSDPWLSVAPTQGADARPVASDAHKFALMCDALPADFSWGDPLTPDVFRYIESALATRDAAPSDAQAQQLRYAIHSLQVIADGIVGPAPYAELAIKHIGVVAEASRSEAVPEGPLKQLGARLATLLDEDQFNGIEPLLDACTQPMKRYVVQKQSGSSMARVIDTHSGMTIKAYDIFMRNGWDAATKHAESLNVAASTPREKT